MRCVLVNRFYYPDYSGTAQMTTDLAVYLSSLGHEVRVIGGKGELERGRADVPVVLPLLDGMREVVHLGVLRQRVGDRGGVGADDSRAGGVGGGVIDGSGRIDAVKRQPK